MARPQIDPPYASPRTGPGVLLGGVAIAGVAAVGVALVSQHLLGMEPCPWCVLQRVIFLAISLVCALGLLWPSKVARVLTAGLGALLAVSGMAAALWQHLVAAKSDSCDITLADRIVSGLHLDALWPDVFLALSPCGDAAASLLGIPFPFWSLALFALMGAACGLAIRRNLLV